ncbi:MAG TPA: MoaD/ThiS family protein [Dehalococcoidia bacterium]|nr:MoaD/ThiS family protein [Dehalococcoidia bacterium]
MSVKVRIPGPLRRLTGGQDVVEVEASTLAEGLQALEALFPGMRERLCEEDGQIRRFINVYVNGEDVRFLQELETALKPGDEISIVPAIAGG